MSNQGRTDTTEQLLEADRREPNAATFASGVSSAQQHAALRASVRQLGALLGEALDAARGTRAARARRAGARRWPASPRTTSCAPLLDGVDAPTAVVLARAFTAYFQLVNVTEQLHRWQELSAVEEGPLAATVRPHRRGARGRQPRARRARATVLARLEYRPVFTAHPTEATRRTVLNLLRRDRRHRATSSRTRAGRPPTGRAPSAGWPSSST